ncbi:hypothetical protein ACIQUQ_04000 [Streptomyces sp. NPDC101118]|uniref:hypothetical protein n=1 Tax=Streptomyces sp. NPDC101118 TaxID=3366109 RepID=UPI003823E63F
MTAHLPHMDQSPPDHGPGYPSAYEPGYPQPEYGPGHASAPGPQYGQGTQYGQGDAQGYGAQHGQEFGGAAYGREQGLRYGQEHGQEYGEEYGEQYGQEYADEAPGQEPAALSPLYAWAGTGEGPDPLPMVHFTTDDQEVALTPEGLGRWPFHEAIREGGWYAFTDYDGWAVPAETWGAAYRREDDMLVVSGPGLCAAWYQGSLGATEEWVAAATAAQSVVLLTAPVQHPSMYGYAVEAGYAYALIVPLAVV